MAAVAQSQTGEPHKKTKNSKKSKKGTTSDWDVDDYKTEYESEEHWELRRNFMLAHKQNFDEDRLVCLAQTFINMEFLGCKYPKDTMLQVAEMSKEVAEEFRKNRALRLKRTFVSASDAAEQRAKGRKGGTQPQHTHRTANDNDNSGRRDRLCFGGGEPINLFEGLRFGNLILYLAGGRSCLRNSCTIAKVKYDERQSDSQQADATSKTAEVLVNDQVIATGSGENIKAAKQCAYQQAVNVLQTHCYSIKLNASRETIKVEKGQNGVQIKVTKESADSLEDRKLDASNKGYRMMRLMGWTGGGLGRLKQGREDPVGYLFKNNRMGLGSKDPQTNLRDYRKLIENYVANSEDMRDMQFEPTFSKEERAAFHKIASKFGLRSASYGIGDDRRLLITKKINHQTILQEILCRRNPKVCERYFVQVPMQKAHLFPGHVAALDLEGIAE